MSECCYAARAFDTILPSRMGGSRPRAAPSLLGEGWALLVALFELGDETQRTPIEVDDGCDGHGVLRLRRGAAVTGAFLRELNDLIGPDAPSPRNGPGHHSVAEVASIPVSRGVIRVGTWLANRESSDRRIEINLIGRGLNDTAELTVAAALALADTLRLAAQEVCACGSTQPIAV